MRKRSSSQSQQLEGRETDRTSSEAIGMSSKNSPARKSDHLYSKHLVSIIWSPLQQKQEISNTVRCLQIALYILTIYVQIFYMYFNLSNFSDVVQRLTFVERMCIYLPFAEVQYAVYIFIILCPPDDGYSN